MNSLPLKPTFYNVPAHIDRRGIIWPVELPAEALRYYIAQNSSLKLVRAWHGHPKEWRYIYCIQGMAKVCALNINDHSEVHEFTLVSPTKVFTSNYNGVVYFPPGYATGWQNLTMDTRVLFVSPAHYVDRDDTIIDENVRRDVWNK